MSGSESEDTGGNKPTGYVYTIVERPGKDPIWLRIGAAWVNKDFSLNCTLNALPVNGKIHIRSPSPDDADSEDAEGGPVAAPE